MNVIERPERKADILVVDDVETNVSLLLRILKRYGYNARGVSGGELALTEIQASHPDLILLDIMMPDIDGYEVCDRLNKTPETRDIPVIFISALSEGLDKAKAFKVGGKDYISKPFQIEEILARVENQLTQRALQKQLEQQAELLGQQNLQLQAEINERQLLEDKLRSAEEKMRAVFEAMTDIVAILDLEEGQIGNIDILPTNWVRLYQPDTDAIGKTIEQFFLPETADMWLSVIRQVLETHETVNFDYSLDTDSQEIWLSAAISPVSENKVILVARDISDRKQAEEALRIAEERYHSIVENAVAGIFQATPEGRYLSANAALAKILGYASPKELLASLKNSGSQLYVDPVRRQEFLSLLEENNAVSGFEAMVYRQDRSIIWISKTARAVKDANGELLYYEGIMSDITERKLAQEALKYQQAQTEELLLNILPQPIATRLQKGENPIADRFEEVSVLFADLVGFTQFCSQKPPEKLVQVLNKIFSEFDRLAKERGLEKIKTIGDAYMVVGGLPVPNQDAAAAIANMALDMRSALAKFNEQHQQTFEVRIGIHIGPVVAGVIGMSKFIYDLWGDTVNIASRMESSGVPGQIQVTAATYERLHDSFEFAERGIISVKGKGEMLTYWLLGNHGMNKG